jgi:hypothetical protein
MPGVPCTVDQAVRTSNVSDAVEILGYVVVVTGLVTADVVDPEALVPVTRK